MFFPVNGDVDYPNIESQSDPYYKQVVLHLPMTGPNNSTSFLDVNTVTNATRYGDVKISTAQSKWGQGSGYFDGAGDYLSAITGELFDSQNLTIELFFFLTTLTGSRCLVGKAPDGENVRFSFVIKNGTAVEFKVYDKSLEYVTVNYNFSVNTWYHIALVKIGNTIKFFVDGVEIGSGNIVGNFYGDASYPLSIGYTGYWGEIFQGYMQDLRVTKGIARYTSRFPPPQQPLEIFRGTVLQLLMNGADNSTSLVDSSLNPKIITRVGNPLISTAQSKWGKGSGYFNGTWLTVNDRNLYLDFTRDFTIECWIYPTVSSTQERELFSTPYNASFYGHYIACYNGNCHIGLSTQEQPTTWGSESVGFSGIVTDDWNHVAFCRSGNTLYAFLNGTLKSTKVMTRTVINQIYGTYSTMMAFVNVASNAFIGYVNDFRVTKNLARYTTDFIPPTNHFTDFSSIALHLPMTGANNSTSFIDVSPIPKTITRNGGAIISSAQSKWGQGSGYFDGVGDSIHSIDTGIILDLSDFTIEMYAFFINGGKASQYHTRLFESANWVSGGVSGSITLATIPNQNPTTLFCELEYTDGMNPSQTLANNTWHHIAVTRQNNLFRLFYNGILVGSLSKVVNLSKQAWSFGGAGGARLNQENFYGYLQDLRIIKGIARYTSDFAPPSGPLPIRLPESSVCTTIQPSFQQIRQLGL